MKRKRQKTKSTKNSFKSQSEPSQPKKPKINRRDFLGNSVIYSIGIAALAGGGLYFANTIRVSAKESDLSKIGNGIPTIVQIHDPSCPTCNALQREAREAVCSFEDDKLQFLVANLNTEEGKELAAKHRVGKITLLLFDGKGRMRIAIPGLNTAEHLGPVFTRHVARYSRKSSS